MFTRCNQSHMTFAIARKYCGERDTQEVSKHKQHKQTKNNKELLSE